MDHTDRHIISSVVNKTQSQLSRVDVAMAPEKESTKDRLSKEVENSIENCLRVWRDDITALTDTPSDRIQNPKEGCQGATVQERSADILAKCIGVPASIPDEHVRNVAESSASENEVAPFVGSLYQSSDESSNDHEFIKQDHEKNLRAWNGSSKEQI
jgi:hypothetical protein